MTYMPSHFKHRNPWISLIKPRKIAGRWYNIRLKPKINWKIQIEVWQWFMSKDVHEEKKTHLVLIHLRLAEMIHGNCLITKSSWTQILVNSILWENTEEWSQTEYTETLIIDSLKYSVLCNDISIYLLSWEQMAFDQDPKQSELSLWKQKSCSTLLLFVSINDFFLLCSWFVIDSGTWNQEIEEICLS